MDTRQIQKPLRVFLNRIHKRYPSSQVILYGSYARGEATAESDVDILVVSEAFRSISDYDRFRELYLMSSDLEPEFHVYGLSPDELPTAAQLTTVREALQTGVRIDKTIPAGVVNGISV